MLDRLRRFAAARRSSIFLVLAPVLLLGTLLAWAFASPVGSGPDDDFHLTSIWCATGDDRHCEHEPGQPEATVPAALLSASCYAFDPDESAGCQDGLDFAGEPDRTTERGNFYGAYPPVFYAAMSVFVGDDIVASVLRMRVVNAVLFTAMATVLFLALPPVRRPTLVWSWAVTTVPLGLFVLTSTNPSAWSVAGIGFGWIALAGFFESSGWRKVVLGITFGVSTVLAAGSRGDATVYGIIAIAAVLILYARRSRAFLLDSILPAVAVVFCLLMFRVSRPVEDATQGVDEGAGLGALLARVMPVLFDVPSIWTGIFGNGWGLGWLDTSMPSVVWLGALACFLGGGIIAAGQQNRRKLVVLVGGVMVLWWLPTLVLVLAGESVGDNIQPRYLLPLIVLFAGVLFWEPRERIIEFTRLQRLLIVVTLAFAHSIALHLNIGRYVRGFDDLGVNLDEAIEWWWPMWISPMSSWAIGSLAYAALIAVLLIYRPNLAQINRPPK